LLPLLFFSCCQPFFHYFYLCAAFNSKCLLCLYISVAT
jgi:hypothetical protein